MSCPTALSRRTFLRGALALATAQVGAARTLAAASGPRVATLDWALLETLLDLGADVVAAPELRQFREVAVEPKVPDTVADLGLRGLPNLETLALTRPDVIFNSNFYAWADPLLSRIAPTHNLGIYLPNENPYLMAQKVTLAVGKTLNLPQAEAVVAQVDQRLDVLQGALSQFKGRPVLLINLGDARHYRVFGADSMFGTVLERLGIENAWTGTTAYSAAAPVGIETLASMPDAWIVLIPPHPLDAMAALERSAFWNALPAVRERRVLTLASTNPYGALPAARRFAEELSKGLLHA